MTKASELRELNLDELEQRLLESKHELFNLRFQLATGKQDNSARLGAVRKDIARIATLLREREIDAAEAAERSAAGTTTEDRSR
jgi:large subunit ribosomal protein L29